MNAQIDAEPRQALIARQPIVDRSGALVAYELLFRRECASVTATIDDGVRATTNVILNTVSEFGADRVLGTMGGVVNICQQWIDRERLAVLAPERFTLELLETVEFDAATIAECKALHEQGYALALDDVVDLSSVPREVLDLVDVVKVDVSVTPAPAIERILADAKRSQWKVLAEKVETPEQYAQLRQQGFDLFQGFFFARPELLAQRQFPKSASSLLCLLKLLAQDPSIAQLEALVKKSPVLLTRLMKLAQSAAYGKSDGETLTVSEAIMRVGIKALSRWVQLLLFAGDCEVDLAANPLFQMVAVRARYMELLSEAVVAGNRSMSDAAYQTGVYSLLHVLTGQPRAEFLSQWSIPAAQRSAIEAGNGTLGDILRIAEAIDLDRSPADAIARLGLSERTIMALHYQANFGVAQDLRA